MPETSTNKDRLSFRLERRHKALIEGAASALGQSVTEFAVSRLVRYARDVLGAHETTLLSDRDRRAFLSVLDSDAEPNEALKKAAQTYRRQRA